jgi:hypothetical protein
MAEKSDIQPTDKPRLMDLLNEAGIDVSDWKNSRRGKKFAALNPRYCYNCAFVQPNTVVVINFLIRKRAGSWRNVPNWARPARATPRGSSRQFAGSHGSVHRIVPTQCCGLINFHPSQNSSKYIAPTGLFRVLGIPFYKDIAPNGAGGGQRGPRLAPLGAAASGHG